MKCAKTFPNIFWQYCYSHEAACICHKPTACGAPDFFGEVQASLDRQCPDNGWITSHRIWRGFGWYWKSWPFWYLIQSGSEDSNGGARAGNVCLRRPFWKAGSRNSAFSSGHRTCAPGPVHCSAKGHFGFCVKREKWNMFTFMESYCCDILKPENMSAIQYVVVADRLCPLYLGNS